MLSPFQTITHFVPLSSQQRLFVPLHARRSFGSLIVSTIEVVVFAVEASVIDFSVELVIVVCTFELVAIGFVVELAAFEFVVEIVVDDFVAEFVVVDFTSVVCMVGLLVVLELSARTFLITLKYSKRIK